MPGFTAGRRAPRGAVGAAPLTDGRPTRRRPFGGLLIRVRRALALAAGALTAACAAHPESVLAPAGPVARSEYGLITQSLLIMIAVAIAVFGPLVYILVRYRERRGEGRQPPQVEGNHTLEVVWTAVPFALLIILAVPTIRDTFTVAAAPAGSDPLQVTVVGHQWWWEFDYPAYGIVTADEMHIPAGRTVAITLRSADVIHNFWVPALAGKQDTIPGQDVGMWLEADRPGTYPGECAEFCGLSHSRMRFDVVAQSAQDFSAWVSGMQHPQGTPQTTLAAQGQALFQQLSCGSCHAIAGTPFQGKVGPNLTGLGNRGVVVAGALANNPTDLGQWLHDPQAIIAGTVMPSFPNLTADQTQALAAYLEGLK